MEVSSEHKKSNDIPSELNIFINEITEELKYKDFKLTFTDDECTGRNFLGVISRVKILGKTCDDKNLEMNLLIKKALSSFKNISVPISLFYQREIAVYSVILPTLKNIQVSRGIPEGDIIKFAKMYRSSSQKGQETLVLSDLAQDGFEIYSDGKAPMNYDHMEVIIKYLARLHAASFILRVENPPLLHELAKKVAVTSMMSENLLKSIESVAEKILKEVEDTPSKRKAEEVLKNMSSFCNDLLDSKQHEPYNVICHGDIWTYNMLFQYKDSRVEDVILIDWQIVHFAPPPSDVACCLCLCTDGALLDQHFHRLLEVYYSTLEDHVSRMGGDLTKIYPKYIYKEHVRMYMITGFFLSFLNLAMTLNEPGEEQSLERALETGLTYNENVIDRISKLIDFYGKYDLF